MWKNEVGHEDKKNVTVTVQLQKVIMSKHFSLFLNFADFAGEGSEGSSC